MKTGVIVYVMGNEPMDNDFDEERMKKDMALNADRVELVFSGDRHFDVMDAWFKLTTKGMHRIICKLGEIAGHSSIKLTEHELHLCGY